MPSPLYPHILQSLRGFLAVTPGGGVMRCRRPRMRQGGHSVRGIGWPGFPSGTYLWHGRGHPEVLIPSYPGKSPLSLGRRTRWSLTGRSQRLMDLSRLRTSSEIRDDAQRNRVSNRGRQTWNVITYEATPSKPVMFTEPCVMTPRQITTCRSLMTTSGTTCSCRSIRPI